MTDHLAYPPVGYDYQADHYCLYCIPAVVAGTVGYRQDECNCAECQLDRIAAVRGINREDERSYDMDAFPKAIPYFSDIHAECGPNGIGCREDEAPACYARCAKCGQVIDGPCAALEITHFSRGPEPAGDH